MKNRYCLIIAMLFMFNITAFSTDTSQRTARREGLVTGVLLTTMYNTWGSDAAIPILFILYYGLKKPISVLLLLSLADSTGIMMLVTCSVGLISLVRNMSCEERSTILLLIAFACQRLTILPEEVYPDYPQLASI